MRSTRPGPLASSRPDRRPRCRSGWFLAPATPAALPPLRRNGNSALPTFSATPWRWPTRGERRAGRPPELVWSLPKYPDSYASTARPRDYSFSAGEEPLRAGTDDGHVERTCYVPVQDSSDVVHGA